MEPKNEKKELNFLDDIEEKREGNAPTRMILIVLGVAVLGIALTFLWGKERKPADPSEPKAVEGSDFKALQDSTQDFQIIDFAERFAIMAFNVSYTDIDRQEDKVANLMVDNLMGFYRASFLDPSWVNFLRQKEAYVVYQKIDRATILRADGTHYWVKVIGRNLFNSGLVSPPSQLDLGMNLIVVVKNDNGVLQISNFQEF